MGKKLELSGVWKKRYIVAKIFVYLFFAIGLAYGAYLILFQSASFIFSFRNPDASKNSIVEPRSENRLPIKNGKVEKGEILNFDANPVGDYSEAEIRFTLEKGSSNPANGSISVRRSYRSFFYPEGEIISDLEGKEFSKLLSNANSVFLASQGKLWPIADAVTFKEMGWNWSDVQPATGEDTESLEKQKLFTLRTPHPDGTIFYDDKTAAYYLIEDGMKKLITDEAMLYPKLMMEPIIADGRGLDTIELCQIEPSFKLLRRYKCKISIEKMKGIKGNDYEFKSVFGNDIDIRDLKVTFKKTLNANNLKSSIATLKSRLLDNYQ